MSVAKKAVDSVLKRILIYTAEIIASIVLLVIISLPMVFMIPMWIQIVLLHTPVANLAVNPIVWFGSAGSFALTIGLGIVSFVLGYPYLLKLVPGPSGEEELEEIDTTLDEESDEELEEESDGTEQDTIDAEELPEEEE
jgi:hypothetical protein